MLLEFDVLLPTVLFIVVSITVLAYQKFGKNLSSMFGEKQLTARDAVLMVISMGIMVTVIAFVPTQAIQILFLAAYSYMLFSFTYLALKRWYLAILPPIVFVLLYFGYWELFVFNLFVIAFAIAIPVYLGSLFSWKTTAIYACLLTIMDVIQVIGTGFMGAAATKMIDLKLPVLLLLPTYPSAGMIGLGLGDIFLAGLLTIQTASRQGQKVGFLTAGTIAIAALVFEVALFNTEFAPFFPATVVVMAGWAAGLGSGKLLGLGYPSGQKAEKAPKEGSLTQTGVQRGDAEES